MEHVANQGAALRSAARGGGWERESEIKEPKNENENENETVCERVCA
jgi:hypothetical protein